MAGTDLVTSGARALIIFEATGAQETIIDAELVTDAIEGVGAAADETAVSMLAASKGLRSFGLESKLLGTGMMVAGKGLKYAAEGLIAVGVGAIWTGVKFQQSMAGVQSVARTNAAGMRLLQDSAISASTTTKFSASQSAQAEMLLARAGISSKGVLQALIPTLDLTTAAQSNVADTATLMGEVMNAFDLHGSKATMVANQLAYAVQGGAMSLDDLNQSMKYVGAAAYATNQPLSGVIGLLKAMALHGVKGSLAGTTLRFAMTRLIKPVKSVTDGLALLNIRQDQFKNSKGLLPMAQILKTMYTHSQALDPNTAKAAIEGIVGVRAITGIMAIFNQGPKAVAEFIKQAQAGTTSAKSMADTINNTIENQLLRFYHILDDIGIMIFMSFAPGVTRAFKALNTAIAPLVRAMPQLQAMVARGDWKGAVYYVDQLTGAHGRLSNIIFQVVNALEQVYLFVKNIVMPLILPFAKAVGVVLYGAFLLIVGILTLFNHHAKLVVFVIKALIIMYYALKLAALAAAFANGELDLTFLPELLMIAAVILVVALLAAGFYELYTHLGVIWKWIKENWMMLGAILIFPFLAPALLIYHFWDDITKWFWDVFNNLGGWSAELEGFIKRPFEAALTWIMGKLQDFIKLWHTTVQDIEGVLGGGSGKAAPNSGAVGKGGGVGMANFVNGTSMGVPGSDQYARAQIKAINANMPLKVLDPLTEPNKDLDPAGTRQTNVFLQLDKKTFAKVVAKHGQDTKARVKGSTG